jgi:hypothetical protein
MHVSHLVLDVSEAREFLVQLGVRSAANQFLVDFPQVRSACLEGQIMSELLPEVTSASPTSSTERLDAAPAKSASRFADDKARHRTSDRELAGPGERGLRSRPPPATPRCIPLGAS